MAHFTITGSIGAIVGSLFGLTIAVMMGIGGGSATIVDIISPAIAGAATAAPLGVTSGISGGLIGGLVGVAFALFPLGWLFIGTPISALIASILTAAAMSSILAITFPH